MVKAVAMALKAVVLGVPCDASKREMLEEDLHWLGYHRFMEQSWNLKTESIVLELLVDKDNRWLGMVRQTLEKWTSIEWRKVHGFLKQTEGMATWTDQYIDGKFSTWVNPKDGYVVLECKDVRAKRVLEILIPILYPEKPTQVTIMVKNTIFGSLLEERPIDWAIVIRDVV